MKDSPLKDSQGLFAWMQCQLSICNSYCDKSVTVAVKLNPLKYTLSLATKLIIYIWCFVSNHHPILLSVYEQFFYYELNYYSTVPKSSILQLQIVIITVKGFHIFVMVN